MRFALTLVASLVLFGGAAEAGYLGASFVSTTAEFEDAVDAIDFDTDDDGWKAFVGFQIWNNLGIEGGYRELGSFAEVVGSSTLDAEIEVIDAALRLAIPLGRRFEVFGKAGYADVEIDGGITGGSADTIFDGDWEPFYGLGASWNFGNFGIRAEWETFDVSDTLNSFSAGAFLNF